MSQTVLQTKNLVKYFYEPTKFKVLKSIDLDVEHGEFLSIVGKSGCGKSTLLYLLSTMDTDYEGEIYLGGELLTGKSDAQLSKIRNEKIGFVFQFHYLLSEFTVLKNVMLPALKLGQLTEKEIKENAMLHLQKLEMESHADKLPNQLSGGQKQRVAIARALINNPIIIMGDEPTGNLDSKNSNIVFDIFKKMSEENQQTILMVTHDRELASRTKSIITMDDGVIIHKS